MNNPIDHPLKRFVAEYPDFPEKGVLFRDISPLLCDQLRASVDALAALITPEEWTDIDTLAGIDSRGFIFASAIAYKLDKKFVMVRKAGKLPGVAGEIAYELEYGVNRLEMQKARGKNVAIFDDVIATGGSLEASCKLCEQVGFTIKAMATLVNLSFLNDFSYKGMKVRSVLDYQD